MNRLQHSYLALDQKFFGAAKAIIAMLFMCKDDSLMVTTNKVIYQGELCKT
jgi:hypothetical protein